MGSVLGVLARVKEHQGMRRAAVSSAGNGGHGDRVREQRRGRARAAPGRVERRVRDGEKCARPLPISSGTGRGGGMHVGHGGGTASAWNTCGHEVEHVASVIHLILEAVLGLITCRTRLWSLKQSCSFPDALQLLFRDLVH